MTKPVPDATRFDGTKSTYQPWISLLSQRFRKFNLLEAFDIVTQRVVQGIHTICLTRNLVHEPGLISDKQISDHCSNLWDDLGLEVVPAS